MNATLSSPAAPANASAEPEPPTRVIRARTGLIGINLAELWRYRELFLFLTWRDILVRYKQTVLGVTWALLQPFLTIVIFTVVFGRLAKFPTYGADYPVMSLAGLLPWQFFTTALSECSGSLVGSSNMISKVYFPRLIVPASAILSGLLNFLISLILLFAFMVWYHVPLRGQLALFPLFLMIASISAFAFGVWLSALNVKYRDVSYIVPFITRIGMYITPVAYASKTVFDNFGHRLYFLYCLNPMVGVTDGFRWCVLGDSKFEPYWPGFCASLGVVTLFLVCGVVYFRTTEKFFADVI